LRSSFYIFLAEKVIDESQLVKGSDREETPHHAHRRAFGALLTLVGAYFLANMTKEIEAKLLPLVEEGMKHVMPSLARGTVDLTDWKTRLQEITQGKTGSLPVYKVVDSQGSENNKGFRANVFAPGVGTGSGIGKSKKQAEQEAARNVLSPLLERNPGVVQLSTSTPKILGENSSPPEEIKAYVKQRTVPKDTLIGSFCENQNLLRQALTHRSFSGVYGCVSKFWQRGVA
jgi:dsRNA-specific ribonuclease